MSSETIDLTLSLESANCGNKNPPQKLVIDTLKKFDVYFEEIKHEINILDLLESEKVDKNTIFDEFQSASYRILLVTYNVEYLIRLLTFHNDTHSQILKLDIQPRTIAIKKEIEYCCNSLQRRRNLCLMFKTLITFSRLIESRRLICDLILKKNRNVKIEQNKDGGIIVVYTDTKRNIKLGVFWSIACSSTYVVTDVIEVYYKYDELPLLNRDEIRNKLYLLTEKSSDFARKYHLWKLLIEELSDRTLFVVIDGIPDTSGTQCKYLDQKVPAKLTVLSDSEDSEKSCGKSLVIKIDKLPEDSTTKNVLSSHDTKNDVQKISLLSESNEPFNELFVKVQKMPENSITRTETSPSHSNNKEETEKLSILSDSEELSSKSLVIEFDEMSDESDSEKPSPELVNVNKLSYKLKVPDFRRQDLARDNDNKKEEEASKVTLVSDFEVVGKIGKPNTSSTKTNILYSQKGIRKEIQNIRVLSSDDEDILKTKGDQRNVSKKPQAFTEKMNCSNTKQLTKRKKLSQEIFSYLRLKKIGKEQNIESSQSISNFLKRRSLRKRQVKENFGTDVTFLHSSSGAARNSKNAKINASDFSFSEEEETFETNEIPETKKVITTKTRSKKKNLISPSGKSPHIISTYNIRKRNDSPTSVPCVFLETPQRKLCSESRSKQIFGNAGISTSNKVVVDSVSDSPIQMLTKSVVPTREKGLVLISDPTTINSVLPTDSLQIFPPTISVTAASPPKNLRIRLTPDTPVNGSPSFVELNLLSPPKKLKFLPKKIDDDLEITSVTFFVPD